MSDFVVSARKYRPSRFDEIVGQSHVSQTLKNALQSNHLAHAFLFCGPRGVGKTSCARILAKVLNCQNVTEDHEPCNECESCQSFQGNTSFNITELDAASNNSVEHIRALIEQVRFQPQQGKYKIFIIDEVHMLSQQAFNAFLKTLEEPPAYAIFILATTEKHKIIPTILSRCQIFDFRRIQVTDMVSHLESISQKESIEADKDALHIIAQKADGALRDSLSIFDRIVAFSGKEIRYDDVIENLNILDYDYFFKMTDAILAEDASAVLNLFDEILRKGFDEDIFINGLAEHLRNILVCKDSQTLQLLEVGESLKKRYHSQAVLSSSTFILTALNIANDCDIEYKMARNKRLHVEIALLKMAYIQRAVELTSATPVESVETPIATQKKNLELSKPPAKPEVPISNTSTEDNSSEKTVSTSQVETEDLPKKEDVSIVEKIHEHEGEPAPQGEQKQQKHKMQKVDLNNLLESVDEISEKVAETIEITQETVQSAWDKYIPQVKSDNLKIVLKNAGLIVEGKEIKISVGSKLAISLIREEGGLIEFLRAELSCLDIMLIFEVDESQKPVIAKPQKPLDARGKFIKMRSMNPAIQDLAKKFQLHPDEDS